MSASNNLNYPKSVSTLEVLDSFLKTIQTIQEILITSNKQEAPYSEINTILSKVRSEVTQEIETLEKEFQEETSSMNRDIPYVNSFQYRIDLAIKRLLN
ncbi:MAG: hypothetical protein RM022_021545 [Nostoc sp. EfeVER01]|uniref:hypothetical protein n=1 Tax=unclassified Nostoc TaxID=2593658 RepID=UPI002AD4DD82|nr:MULTISPECIES: hypothetical protein [unclassified Nostoc]MDZ7949406.1 hypothetical protein [Nostoc sp. EfeVER01]MDZ7993803.1 hypothetical protein [Nostoc sp. EspVER01]